MRLIPRSRQQSFVLSAVVNQHNKPNFQNYCGYQWTKTIRWASNNVRNIIKCVNFDQIPYFAFFCSWLTSWLICSSWNSSFSFFLASDFWSLTIFSTRTCLSTSTNWTKGGSGSYGEIEITLTLFFFLGFKSLHLTLPLEIERST